MKNIAIEIVLYDADTGEQVLYAVTNGFETAGAALEDMESHWREQMQLQEHGKQT